MDISLLYTRSRRPAIAACEIAVAAAAPRRAVSHAGNKKKIQNHIHCRADQY